MEKITPINATAKPDLSYCCAKCPHWNFRNENPQGEKAGECRYNPPVLMLVPFADPLRGNGIRAESHFPLIADVGWCGNHPLRQLNRSRDS